MFATLSPLMGGSSEIFNTNPGEQTDAPVEYLEDLMQHHPLAECSMCGDVGLQQELFECIKCRVRHQHTYCSRYYPRRRSYSGVCDWCHTGEQRDSFAQSKSASTLRESNCANILTCRNDLEMLLAAAEFSTKASVEDKSDPSSVFNASDIGKKPSWPSSKRLRRPMRPKPALGNSSIFKCKHSKLDPSSCPKRIGRRYKCILDVY